MPCCHDLGLQVEFYKGMYPKVREFVATFAYLSVVTDTSELPRTMDDNTCLFSILMGSMEVS